MSTRKTDHLLALDIETVPDASLVPSDWPADAFPKIVWHQVVAISFVEARVEAGEAGEGFRILTCRSGGTAASSELELLRGFWAFFEERMPRVVTWNGRSFDMAVLRMRAMIHGIDVSVWDRSGDKWSGYRHRYSPEWHTDVMDQLCDYGASQKSSLQDVSVALGFPGKIGGSGASVAAMVQRGEIERVRAYCECDAMLTYGCYLHWASSTGLITAGRLADGLADMASFLQDADRAHFAEFLAGWRSMPATRPFAAVTPQQDKQPISGERPFPWPRPIPKIRRPFTVPRILGSDARTDQAANPLTGAHR